MTSNSINNNGCSVCEQGKENYTTFCPAHRPKQRYYQYDYRHADGELFSTVASSLDECRKRRNEWIRGKNEGKFALFIGFQRLGEYDTISQAKQYAEKCGKDGVFNLIGNNYRDSWYVPKKQSNE